MCLLKTILVSPLRLPDSDSDSVEVMETAIPLAWAESATSACPCLPPWLLLDPIPTESDLAEWVATPALPGQHVKQALALGSAPDGLVGIAALFAARSSTSVVPGVGGALQDVRPRGQEIGRRQAL